MSKATARWTLEQITELQRECMSRHLLDPLWKQCSDALGSLSFDAIDAASERAELLAALREFIAWDEADEPYNERFHAAIDGARAALAKAEERR